MSDLTDLLDNATDLLRSLQLAEFAHNTRHYDDLESVLGGVDPVEVKLAIADLREVSLRQKALNELGDGTTGGLTAPTPQVGPASDSASQIPSVPGYSVKVRCS